MLMGVLAKVGFAFRGVVLSEASLKVVGMADIEAPLGVLQDVYKEFSYEKSVIGWNDAFNRNYRF